MFRQAIDFLQSELHQGNIKMNRTRKSLLFGLFLSTMFAADACAQARKGGGGIGKAGGGAAGKSGAFNKSAGGARGGFQPSSGTRGPAASPSGGMNNGLRASGGLAQPGASSSNFQNSMNRIRAGSNGPGVGAPGTPGLGAGAPGATGNPSDRRNNRTDNRSDNRTDRRDAANAFNNGAAPFSAGWYADHPNAWQYTHPHADAFAVAAAPNMYRWWGAPVAGAALPVGVPVGSPATTTTANAPTEGQPGANTAGTNADQGDWLPIGVYSLTHDNSPNEITRALQLATNKAGDIKGNHVDLLTDTTSDVNGKFDAETKTIHWTIGKTDGVVFTANVDDFKPGAKSIPVVSHYSNGSSAKWLMSPIENPESNEEKTGE
jgi:3D (Asp-Asp-Asp) domain-containing protein